MQRSQAILSIEKSLAVTPAQEAFTALLRAFGLLERVMQPYFARFGVSTSQWAVLRTLQRAETDNVLGLRLTDLSERLFIRPPSVTGVVDRLVKMGWVDRTSSAEDLRSKRVRLTERGRQVIANVMSEHDQHIDRALSGLNPDQQKQLRQLLVRLGEHLTTFLSKENSADSDETPTRA